MADVHLPLTDEELGVLKANARNYEMPVEDYVRQALGLPRAAGTWTWTPGTAPEFIPDKSRSDLGSPDQRPIASEIAARVGMPGPRDDESPGEFLQRLRDHKPPSDLDAFRGMLERAGIAFRSGDSVTGERVSTFVAFEDDHAPLFRFDVEGRLAKISWWDGDGLKWVDGKRWKL